MILHRTTTLAAAALMACDNSAAPDGHAFQIAYRGQVGSNGGIVVMAADGSDRRVLVTPNDGTSCPSFSPDGGRIAFGDISSNQIAVIDVEARTETQLTSGPALSLCPAWSPDGSMLAFFRGPSTVPNGFGLYVMNANGSNIRELAPDGFGASGMDWSPDGRWLAVARYADFTLVLVDAATGTLGPPLRTGSPTFEPAWSPDGQHLAYVRGAGAGSELYVVNANGTGQRRVTYSPNDPNLPYLNHAPRWSPDGAMIAYWRIGPLTGPSRRDPHVVLIGSDGTERFWKGATPILGDQPFWRRAR